MVGDYYSFYKYFSKKSGDFYSARYHYKFMCIEGHSKVTELEQPDIEFLVTDKFGFFHTGKRSLPGLTIAIQGSPLPTFESHQCNSILYGQGIHINQTGYVYLDVSGDDLNFGGNSTIMDSFTLGYYLYIPLSKNVNFMQIIIHSFTGLFDWKYSRLIPHGNSYSQGMASTISNLTLYIQYFAQYILPVTKKAGWVHIAPNSIVKCIKNVLNSIKCLK